jgi:hypothetical protein
VFLSSHLLRSVAQDCYGAARDDHARRIRQGQSHRRPRGR